jgi:hypothetical protein
MSWFFYGFKNQTRCDNFLLPFPEIINIMFLLAFIKCLLIRKNLTEILFRKLVPALNLAAYETVLYVASDPKNCSESRLYHVHLCGIFLRQIWSGPLETIWQTTERKKTVKSVLMLLSKQFCVLVSIYSEAIKLFIFIFLFQQGSLKIKSLRRVEQNYWFNLVTQSLSDQGNNQQRRQTADSFL